MKNEKAKAEVIQYWMEKDHEALESTRSEQNVGRLVFAVNRAYYACFYSASPVLMSLGKRFRKHSGVRGAVHSLLVESEMLDASAGRFYDLAFKSRQRGDYQELVEFSREEAEEILSVSEAFVVSVRTLLEKMSQGENR